MDIQVRVLGPEDEEAVHRAQAVFDHPILQNRAREFLHDARHHLAAAFVDGEMIGCASAVHYVHPDKNPEMWINEVGVMDEYRRQGVARRLLEALFAVAKSLGCGEAWVLTDAGNDAARQLYRSTGGKPSEQIMYTFLLP